MYMTRWIVITLAVLTGAWMAFDGTRALVTGDYVTATSGPYAGQLGPWSKAVEAVGVNPRSPIVKTVIAVYGLAAVVTAICFALGQSWAWAGLLVVAVLGLWYLPFGTVTGLINLVLLLLPMLRPGQEGKASHA